MLADVAQRCSWARRPAFWTGVFLWLGLGLRSYHYLRNPSLWHDEAALVLNVLAKGFRELLGPLLCAEAAPPLFLWIERAGTLLLGDSTYVLRLFPFLGSCLALMWIVPIARRVLNPTAVPWAVLLFACSDRLLWHACEAKPYALDVLAGVAVVGVFCEAPSWSLGRRLAVYTLLAPVVIFLGYPGCFLFGGVLLALLPSVWREHRLGTWLRYGLLVLAVFASFALLSLGPVRAQRCADMVCCWERQFPLWNQPHTVPSWVVWSTADVFRYCCKPLGQFLSVLSVIGAVTLCRGRQRALVVLLTMPLGLALVAACLHAYPYGGARVEVFAAPALVLLIAAGVPPTLAWLRRQSDRWRGAAESLAATRSASRFAPSAFLAAARLAIIVVLVSPLELALYRVAVPWERADCAGAAAYVLSHRQPADQINANSWVYPYYFRAVRPALRLMGDPWLSDEKSWLGTADRQWVVLTADHAEERTAIVELLPFQEWRLLDWREFALTTVLLLGKK